MRQPTIYVLGLALLLTESVALAQTDSARNAPNPTAIGMIRATLEFLATDEKSFGRVPNPICQPCSTYEELTAFAKKNRLRGGDELVNDARREARNALQTNPATLPATLQAFLLDRVAGGTKSNRKQLPTFATFQQKLSAAAGGQPAETEPIVAADDSALTDTASAATDETLTTEAELETDPTTAKPLSIMQYLPLIFSLISLVGVVLLWIRSQNRSEPVKQSYDGQIAALQDRIKRLEDANRQLRNQTEPRPGNPTPRPQPSAQSQQTPVQPRMPMAESEPTSPAADVVPPIVSATPPPASSPIAGPMPNSFRSTPSLLYGRTADLGDGFSSSGLSATPDRDTVFEIHRQTDTQAVFQVSDQPDLQRLALSDPYSYLNDTCSYQMQPRPGSRIRTEKPGKLSLQGDKWAIVEKAQISFLS
ncbi:hypothetical protein [Spirosoma montaniterrae]|uniref:Uncharacterized protein n=1 Tax=Spirosoma montaniterrae TaxID=1178516 RepID=A0A1P9WSG4_9BACT|nr:hypothetical protein [Spirosoma montaniterrae]AQG78308.1 hypothetical protein AWR27_02500 [Spirosoma montaniterrae]